MDQRHWVVADASSAGVVRFGNAPPGAVAAEAVCAMPSSEHSTFTDALLAYQRHAGITLRGAECVLAVAGIAVGESIPIMRTRWTVSRAGLRAVFDRAPIILNDVAATAWSLLGGARVEALGGSALPDFARPGRWALVLLDEGVGTAALDVAPSGVATVLDAEAGHIGFAPASEAEAAHLARLRARSPHVSWEAALARAGQPRDEEWAGMAGAFAGDVVLALGAWSGVIVTGRHAAELRQPRLQAAFERRMLAKSCYTRQLAQAGRWLLVQRDPLAGALALLRAQGDRRAN